MRVGVYAVVFVVCGSLHGEYAIQIMTWKSWFGAEGSELWTLAYDVTRGRRSFGS